MRQQSNRPDVRVPDRSKDQPVWARVGVIAIVGFMIGIAWPRLAGVRLGPTPPEEGSAPAVEGSSSAEIPTGLDSAPAASASAPTVARAVAVQTQAAVVKRTEAITCRDNRDKVVQSCDNPNFDGFFVPRLETLARCPSAAGLGQKLSIGFDVDFRRDRVNLLRGKSTTIPYSTVSGIWACVEHDLKGVRPVDIKHEQSRYTVFYTVQFYPPGAMVDASALASTTANTDDAGSDKDKESKESVTGNAQVVYDTVLVRDEPKTGKVVARLVRGTGVQLLEKKGSWYKVRFGDREGWVYRGAIAQ